MVDQERRTYAGREVPEASKLSQIRNRVDPSFHNKDAFFSAIDALPGGVDWQCQDICLTGDVPNQDGELPSENLELWFRDPQSAVL